MLDNTVCALQYLHYILRLLPTAHSEHFTTRDISSYYRPLLHSSFHLLHNSFSAKSLSHYSLFATNIQYIRLSVQQFSSTTLPYSDFKSVAFLISQLKYKALNLRESN